MIVADTGAIVALIDRDDRHHAAVLATYEDQPDEWVLPWAILPEVDYLLSEHVKGRAPEAFRADLASGAYAVIWGDERDLARAHALCTRYHGLRMGLVDGVVMSIAERFMAKAIATLDLRHFGAVELRAKPALVPRDRSPRRR